MIVLSDTDFKCVQFIMELMFTPYILWTHPTLAWICLHIISSPFALVWSSSMFADVTGDSRLFVYKDTKFVHMKALITQTTLARVVVGSQIQ